MTEPAARQPLTEELDAERARVAAEVREIDALVQSTRGEVARLGAKEDAAAAALDALRARPDAAAAEVLAAADELAGVLRRKGAMGAELETLQAKRKLLDRLDAQLGSVRARAAEVPSSQTAAAAPAGDGETFRAVVAAQEDERRRIARAVHDGPAQSMANIVLQTEISERLFATDVERARTELASLRATVNRTLQELRAFIFELRPMILDDLGLVPTLRRYLQTVVEKNGVAVDFSSVGRDRRLRADDEVAVFRLIQDALHERIGGAGAKDLSLAMDWRDDQVEIRLVSDGAPLRASHAAAERLVAGERVRLLNATAAVDDRSDGRAVFVFHVPVVAPAVG